MSESENPPFAPAWKDKIGGHLSYPLKFSELAAILAPANERLGLRVSFWGWKAPRQNEIRENYPVIEANYSASEPFGDQPWRIYVQAIPKALRPMIRPLLLSAGLERVGQWLLAPRPAIWLSGGHSLRISFNPATESFQYEEH